MKILVLGGCGIQGRTALCDLASDSHVSQIICADIRFDELSKISDFMDMEKITTARIDAQNRSDLLNLYKKVDVVIDLLPKDFKTHVNEAALEAKVPVVNTNYMYDTKVLDKAAKEAGIAIMPECGLDPGIDLVIYGDAQTRFDSLSSIKSYCGGFPERKACTNPMNYKLSWIWRGVLSSTMRDGRIIKDRQIIAIPSARQHDESFVHEIEFPDLGTLEAIPNGDAVFFTDRMGLTKTIVNTGRYSLRWPGWSAFWRPLKALGFLSEDPVKGLDGTVSPMDFMDKHLGPQLAYQDDEKDLVAMINIFEGIKDNKKIRFTSSMLIERDLETGIMAMSKGVGYTAAIAARMIVRGDIKEKGVLSPMNHIPVEKFMNELKKRGIQIKEETTILEE
ncbi:saccharopine dehydrogenase C-terminal domain-containing protein [Desulfobacula sp.]|uniref:saccharopine dehydrogenase family protein n=1 Tax=Desulfobacula sp. TaxID=2593537 RepID=UPI0025B9DD26|nr:saccharopine dehydrogenase C-terminal domain-containing protein [Desulfobacula sp.]MBC2704442.1 saccharopine dehydrogenase NADP-binding domain-containing protein [Desulfobacula sp.]